MLGLEVLSCLRLRRCGVLFDLALHIFSLYLFLVPEKFEEGFYYFGLILDAGVLSIILCLLE